jgi:hypothetical protein
MKVPLLWDLLVLLLQYFGSLGMVTCSSFGPTWSTLLVFRLCYGVGRLIIGSYYYGTWYSALDL